MIKFKWQKRVSFKEEKLRGKSRYFQELPVEDGEPCLWWNFYVIWIFEENRIAHENLRAVEIYICLELLLPVCFKWQLIVYVYTEFDISTVLFMSDLIHQTYEIFE